HLTVAGTKDAINMVEASAKEVSEDDILEGLMFGHEEIKRLIDFQLEIQKAVGKEKAEVELRIVPEEIDTLVRDMAEKDLLAAVVIKEKLERYGKIDEINERVIEELTEKFKEDEDKDQKIKFVKEVLENIVSDEVRRLITHDHIRPDGRGLDEIRPLSSRVDILERTHGSALFTRGQTQSLCVTTLGAL